MRHVTSRLKEYSRASAAMAAESSSGGHKALRRLARRNCWIMRVRAARQCLIDQGATRNTALGRWPTEGGEQLRSPNDDVLPALAESLKREPMGWGPVRRSTHS